MITRNKLTFCNLLSRPFHWLVLELRTEAKYDVIYNDISLKYAFVTGPFPWHIKILNLYSTQDLYLIISEYMYM